MKVFLKSILIWLLNLSWGFAQEGVLKIGPTLNGVRSIVDINLHDNELSVLTKNKKELNYWKLSPVSLIPNGKPKAINFYGKNLPEYALNTQQYELFKKVSLSDKELLFYKHNENKESVEGLYFQELDLSFKPLNGVQKLASRSNIKLRTGFLGLNKMDGGGFYLKTNQTSEKILVINQAPATKADSEIISGPVTFSLYDVKTMQPLLNTTMDVGVPEFGDQAVLSENNFAYTLTSASQQSRAERRDIIKSGEAPWFYKITGVDLNHPDTKPFVNNLLLKGKGILNAALTINSLGELVCAGTYSEINRSGSTSDFDGIFYIRLNPENGTLLSESNKKIDRSTIEFMTSKKIASRNNGIPSEFKLRGLETMENGTTNLILEEDYFYTVTYSNGRGGVSSTNHYISKAILVANISPNGEIIWIKHIPKFQHSTNDNGVFNSFTYCKIHNELRFVFSDNERNYDSKTNEIKPENTQNINRMAVSETAKSIALARIDGSGNVQQKLLARTKKDLLFVRHAEWTSSGNELYLQSVKRMKTGQWLLGIIVPPYGLYLLIKSFTPQYALARVELNVP